MAVLFLVSALDPILRTKAERFDFLNPPRDPVEIARDLADTMTHHQGYGLAANQVGLPYNVFVMGQGTIFTCFNPRIVNMSVQKATIKEGCLSFHGLILNIERPVSIRARYTQPNGETITQDYTGMTARIFQHEFDHLQGKLFTEYVSKLEMEIARKKARKLLKK